MSKGSRKKNRKNKKQNKKINQGRNISAASKARNIFDDNNSTPKVEELFTQKIKGSSDEREFTQKNRDGEDVHVTIVATEEELKAIAELKRDGLFTEDLSLEECVAELHKINGVAEDFSSAIKEELQVIAAEPKASDADKQAAQNVLDALNVVSDATTNFLNNKEGDNMSENANKKFDANKTASETMNAGKTEAQSAAENVEEIKTETVTEEEVVEEVIEEVVQESKFKAFFTNMGRNIKGFFTKIRKFVVRRKVKTVVTVVASTAVGVAAGIFLPVTGAAAVIIGLSIAGIVGIGAIIAQAYADKGDQASGPKQPLADKVAEYMKAKVAESAANAEAYDAAQASA